MKEEYPELMNDLIRAGEVYCLALVRKKQKVCVVCGAHTLPLWKRVIFLTLWRPRAHKTVQP